MGIISSFFCNATALRHILWWREKVDFNQANVWLTELDQTLFQEAKLYAINQGISFVLAVGVLVGDKPIVLSRCLHPKSIPANTELITDLYYQCRGILLSQAEVTFEGIDFANFRNEGVRVCLITSGLLDLSSDCNRNQFYEWEVKYFAAQK